MDFGLKSVKFGGLAARFFLCSTWKFYGQHENLL